MKANPRAEFDALVAAKIADGLNVHKAIAFVKANHRGPYKAMADAAGLTIDDDDAIVQPNPATVLNAVQVKNLALRRVLPAIKKYFATGKPVQKKGTSKMQTKLSPQAERQRAIDKFTAKIEEFMSAKNITRLDAILEVTRAYPETHRAYLAATNPHINPEFIV